jgi:hypothetical protein
VIAALLTNRTVKSAATKAGVPTRTLRRWLTEDAQFKRELHRRETELLNAAGRDALKRTKDAVDVLHEVMSDKTEAGQTRVRAACAMLEYSAKFVEVVGTDARITMLEED